MEWQAVATVVSAVISLVALGLGIVQWRKSVRLQNEQQQSSQLLLRRQLFVQIWPHISGLSKIDPDPRKVIEVDVIKTVNALELVAVCWEGQAVDRGLIRRAFGDTYIEYYESIKKCGTLPTRGSGEELLKQAPAVRHVYNALVDERKERDRLQATQDLTANGPVTGK